MIFGITGTIGAGKGTVAEHLAEKGFRHVSVSKFLFEEAARRGLPPTRVTCREIANEFRAKSPTALIDEVLADANPLKENFVVEALHTVPEVEYIQHLRGKVFSVDAPLPVRFKRIKGRGDEKDSVSLEEFVVEQNRQMVSQNPDENNLAEAMVAADFHLETSQSTEELFARIDGILDKV